mmetsp:Transcript_33943/g.54024  ORF Transcript_33943/g.54024 Transcript_33943/m.54024 type:complete len:224 (+) Transcript_33943:898-1569(+)
MPILAIGTSRIKAVPPVEIQIANPDNVVLSQRLLREEVLVALQSTEGLVVPGNLRHANMSQAMSHPLLDMRTTLTPNLLQVVEVPVDVLDKTFHQSDLQAEAPAVQFHPAQEGKLQGTKFQRLSDKTRSALSAEVPVAILSERILLIQSTSRALQQRLLERTQLARNVPQVEVRVAIRYTPHLQAGEETPPPLLLDYVARVAPRHENQQNAHACQWPRSCLHL